MIAMGTPKAGNHNDLYEIEEVWIGMLLLGFISKFLKKV